MNLYFVILTFCLVGPVYSSGVERYVKMAKAPTTIICDQNSIVVTNNSNDCSGGQSCNFSKDTPFVCLRSEFQKSRCQELTRNTVIDPNVCYVSNENSKFELSYPSDPTKFFHVFVLRNSIEYPGSEESMKYRTAFFHYVCCRRCNYDCNNVKVDGKSWILTTASENSEEDFGQFLTDLPGESSSEGETYEVEKFLRIAHGFNIVACGEGSSIVTNIPHHCAGSRSCMSHFNKTVIGCLKNDFEISKCRDLTRNTPISESGCYVGKEENRFIIPFSQSSATIYHIFVLRKSVEYTNIRQQTIKGPAYHYTRCVYPCAVTVDGDTWILVKASRKGEEDFGEFFVVPRLGTP